MTAVDSKSALEESLPRWNVSDIHESFAARSFTDAMDRCGADMSRLEALFEEHGIRATEPRPVTTADGRAADAVITATNSLREHADLTAAYILATTTTDSYNETAEGLLGEFEMVDVRQRSLTARLAAWVSSLGVDQLATVSDQVAEHYGPLEKLARRAAHQMSESEEGLYADLVSTGSSAWDQLHGVVTSQLAVPVNMPDGSTPSMPMAAVRGLATHADPAVRKAAYEAELAIWPTVAPVCAAAMNAVKGEANVVNRRRGWQSPLDASLFSNSVSRATFDAMQQAITESLDDMRGWMQSKARLLGHAGPLPWYDLVAPLPFAPPRISWEDGVQIVRNAFASYGGGLNGLIDRALSERWVDAGPRAGKQGGAFCMSLVADRSLVFLNWSGSFDSAQTTAHELGHAYHNTQLAHRTPMQRDLPMALAETASIFCETLVVEEGLQRLTGTDKLALLDVDLQGTAQVVVDIRSRFLFETEVFARRQRRTLGVGELNKLMQQAQADAYGDGLLQSTAHPYMWAVKPHYYAAHFYNWPYTYGLLFGLGLFAQYQQDPERFKAHYDDALSRAGMNSAEDLAAVFGFDVTDQAFWTASLEVVRGRIADYNDLANNV